MLHAAAMFGHVEVIQLLLSRGFSTAVTNMVRTFNLQTVPDATSGVYSDLIDHRCLISGWPYTPADPAR
jgi:hypothetical protein